MIGRLSERRYQLAAEKRNEAEQKFDYYRQTAKYFERECRKAEQFNTWTVKEYKSTHWEKIKKIQDLNNRRDRLQRLLGSDAEQYKSECEQLKARKASREISLEELKEKLKASRSERSLYHPKISRRIQSYFCYPTTQNNRSVLREINTLNRPKMSTENIKSMSECDNSEIHANIESDAGNTYCKDAFDQRAHEYEENRSNATHSHFGYISDAEVFAKPSHDYSPTRESANDNNHSPSHRVKRSDSAYFFGHQVPLPNAHHDDKYAERYSHSSLRDTNVSHTGSSQFYTNDSQKQNNTTITWETNDCDRKEMTDEIDQTDSEINHREDELSVQMDAIQLSNVNKSPRQEETADASGNTQLTSSDENRSDMMFMYLTHNDIKRKIEDLEMRENRATMKHLWEEALRLRDMKNRLELLRDKQIYYRKDLHIDEKSHQSAMDNIEARDEQLDKREKLCDSWMFSEEAKDMWDKWVAEDKVSHIANVNDSDCAEALLGQLEKEWMSMDESEKQKVSNSYNHVMTGSSVQTELHKLTKKMPRG